MSTQIAPDSAPEVAIVRPGVDPQPAADLGETAAADPRENAARLWQPTARRIARSTMWRSGLVALATWAAAATTYVMVTLLSWMINDKQGPLMPLMYEYWNHWDTGHYIRIAQIGYTADRTDTHAFFPLFPLLLRVVDVVVPGPTLVAALVLANAACVGALLILHRFAIYEFDVATADRVLLFLMAWPTAFFLSAGYNESLFVLLSVAAFFLMRRRCWWAAAVLGGLASATRLSGLLLVIVFVAEFVRQRGWRPRWYDGAAILLMPLGLLGFCLYCWATLRDPLAFSHAQGEWGRQFTLPWAGMQQAIATIETYPLLRPVAVHNFVDVVSTAITIILLVEALVGPWLRRDQLPLILYSMASFLVVLTSPVGGDFPLQGSPRYALEFIPIFFLLARLGASRVFERIYLLPAVGLQAVFLLTYINNVWVA